MSHFPLLCFWSASDYLLLFHVPVAPIGLCFLSRLNRSVCTRPVYFLFLFPILLRCFILLILTVTINSAVSLRIVTDDIHRDAVWWTMVILFSTPVPVEGGSVFDDHACYKKHFKYIQRVYFLVYLYSIYIVRYINMYVCIRRIKSLSLYNANKLANCHLAQSLLGW